MNAIVSVPHESLNNLTTYEYQLMAEKPELSKVSGTKTGVLTRIVKQISYFYLEILTL